MRLKEIRKQRGLTQAEVAKKIGVAQNTYSQYENGKREMDTATLCKIADALNVTVDYLIGHSVYEQENDKRFDGMNADEMLEFLANNEKGRVLMSIAKDATKEDLEQIVRIVEALRG